MRRHKNTQSLPAISPIKASQQSISSPTQSPLGKVSLSKKVRSQAQLELDFVKKYVGRNLNLKKRKPDPLLRDHKLDVKEDIQQEWYQKHKLHITEKFTPAQRRSFRRWFNSMDADGSGEVGIKELENPLLSAGVLKSREDLYKMLSEVDKDGSGEISFEEFLSAIYGNKLCQMENLKRLQALCDSDGMNAATKLSEARRRNLMHGVVDDVLAREHTMDSIYGKDGLIYSDKASPVVKDKILSNIASSQHAQKRNTNKYVDALYDLIIEERQSILQSRSATSSQAVKSGKAPSRARAVISKQESRFTLYETRLGVGPLINTRDRDYDVNTSSTASRAAVVLSPIKNERPEIQRKSFIKRYTRSSSGSISSDDATTVPTVVEEDEASM